MHVHFRAERWLAIVGLTALIAAVTAMAPFTPSSSSSWSSTAQAQPQPAQAQPAEARNAQHPAEGRWVGVTTWGTQEGTLIELRVARIGEEWTARLCMPEGNLLWTDCINVVCDDRNVSFTLAVRRRSYAFTGSVAADGNRMVLQHKLSTDDAESHLAVFSKQPMIADLPTAQHFAGHIKLPNIQLDITVSIGQLADGSWIGHIDIVPQNVSEMPLKAVRVAGNKIEFGLPVPRPTTAVFVGEFSEDGQQITGEFRQMGQAFPFELTKRAAATPLRRPQTPAPPFPYTATNVTYPNEAGGGHTMAGTLTVPHGDGPFPAAVLISGSGPQDRDETLFAHRPFHVIADHLSRHGIAVLRYDDRGVAESGGQFAGATSADFATDADAAIRFLRTRSEIDGDKIGLIGHSEGGLIAPLVAQINPHVAFIVMLAGPGVPGDEILYQQTILIGRVNGESEDAIKRTYRLQQQLYGLVKQDELSDADFSEAVGKAVSDYFDEWIPTLSEDERAALPPQSAVVAQTVQTFRDPWIRYFIRHDPRPSLRNVKCPLLAVNGTVDLQVPWDQNLPEIWKALTEGGNEDVTIRAFPKLNHLFQASETGSPNEYGQLEETFSVAVLEYMTDWIRARTR